MFFSTCSAGALSGPDFCFIFAPCGYDEPEILPSGSPSIGLTGADGGQRPSTPGPRSGTSPIRWRSRCSDTSKQTKSVLGSKADLVLRRNHVQTVLGLIAGEVLVQFFDPSHPARGALCRRTTNLL